MFVLSQVDADFKIVIRGDEIIGRKKGHVINNSSLSREHCKISKSLYIFDLKSKYGTFVNEIQVKEAQLKVGDIVRLGKNIQFNVKEIKICTSGITNKKLLEEMNEICRQLDIQIVRNVQECSHLVMEAVKITQKVLVSLCMLKNIVNLNWIRDLREKYPEERLYLPTSSSSDPTVYLPNKNRNRIFEHKIIAWFSLAQLSSYREVIEAGGGECILIENPTEFTDINCHCHNVSCSKEHLYFVESPEGSMNQNYNQLYSRFKSQFINAEGISWAVLQGKFQRCLESHVIQTTSRSMPISKMSSSVLIDNDVTVEISSDDENLSNFNAGTQTATKLEILSDNEKSKTEKNIGPIISEYFDENEELIDLIAPRKKQKVDSISIAPEPLSTFEDLFFDDRDIGQPVNPKTQAETNESLNYTSTTNMHTGFESAVSFSAKNLDDLLDDMMEMGPSLDEPEVVLETEFPQMSPIMEQDEEISNVPINDIFQPELEDNFEKSEDEVIPETPPNTTQTNPVDLPPSTDSIAPEIENPTKLVNAPIELIEEKVVVQLDKLTKTPNPAVTNFKRFRRKERRIPSIVPLIAADQYEGVGHHDEF